MDQLKDLSGCEGWGMLFVCRLVVELMEGGPGGGRIPEKIGGAPGGGGGPPGGGGGGGGGGLEKAIGGGGGGGGKPPIIIGGGGGAIGLPGSRGGAGKGTSL